MARLTRIVNENGEVACTHRDLSVCEECWNATPNLINVYETVYRWDPSQWSAAEGFQIATGQMENVTISPNTEV